MKASKRKGDASEDDEVSNEGALDFGYQLLMECENENSEYLNDFLADVIHKICIFPFFFCISSGLVTIFVITHY